MIGFSVCIWVQSNAQNVAINTTGTAANSSAILDLSNTANLGFLPPQVALTGTNSASPITSPATGLIVYNTATVGGGFAVSPGYYYWNGASWSVIYTGSGAASAWNLTGNTGTSPGINFVGTTDNENLIFKTAGTENMRIAYSTGYVGINQPAPTQQLDIVGNLQFSKALMPNSLAGTAATAVTAASAPPVVAQVLVSAGAGVAPTWNYAGGITQIIYDGVSQTGGTVGWTGATTDYFGPFDQQVFTAAGETYFQLAMPKCVVTRIRINVFAHTLNSASTFYVRKNAANTTLTASVAATTTGVLSGSGSITFNDGDLLSIAGVLGGTGAQSITLLNIQITYYVLP